MPAGSASSARASSSGSSERNSRNSGRKSGNSPAVSSSPWPAIELDQIGHGLTAIAAFAMHVLEQVQRQRAAAIEQREVALLQVVDVASGEFGQQGVDGGALRCRDQALVGERRGDLAGGGLQRLGRIGDQGREGPVGAGHHDTSIGVFGFFASNRLKPVLPEQPSPKEKPQEPRIWKVSSPVSRCAVGMTKRSS